MFKQMQIAVQVYKGQTPSKKIPRSDANCDSYVRKIKVGESASPTNTKKGRTGNLKTKMYYLRERRRLVYIKHACCMDPDTPMRSVKY